MYEVSRFSRAVKDMPQRIKRDSRTWLLACALSLAGMAVAPLAQAKEAPRKPAAAKAAPAAKTAKAAGKSSEKQARSASKADGKASRAGKSADRQQTAKGKGRDDHVAKAKGRAGKGRATALAETGPKNRKAVAEDRIRAVSMA